ncbi:hypothetical protein ACFV0Z_03465 [Streptomyces xiamenensis]|uniref:hypothetical protein n=1 Tax=Streptomyces xiamenensis TaxID=408015 RepID=UPI0036905290
MTPIQSQYAPASPAPARRTPDQDLDPAGPQVCDDMSVEVAWAVMAAAGTGRLVVCDQDDQGTGSVTRAELAAVRACSAYTDRVRLRDIIGDHGAFPSAVTAAAVTERAAGSCRGAGPRAGTPGGLLRSH